MSDFASVDQVITEAMRAWRPPPKLSLSAWADANFFLSAESAAEPGRWRTIPYQRGWMDAITDPTVEQVTVMKSARVGYTKSIDAAIGYFIDQDPCSMLVVQPTVDDAKGFSKEEIAPMLRDCPRLAKLVLDDAEEVGPKDSGNTILHKRYPGGVLSMVGANSGAGFRRISRRVVMFDEVDGYPPSAGSDGDQIKLGIMRTQTFWNRKIVAGSTPLIAGRSRIETLFLAGDQRRYYVPCPHCEHMDFIVFSEREGGGHWIAFDSEKPDDAHLVCSRCGSVVEHSQKRWMVERGEWRASAPFRGHASFHISALYSFSPNSTWAHIAREFLDAKGNSETFKTFVNTVLGETWRERGDAPDWERLYNRREHYPIGSVPEGVLFLTAGVDVQKDRLVWEVIGWGADKESWAIEAGVIRGDTSNEATWLKLDELLERPFDGHQIRMMAVDSGFNTQQVYGWVRRHRERAIAVKGVSTARALIGLPSKVDVTHRGKRIARGGSVWPVGVDIAKMELYGWLRLGQPEPGEPFPAGWRHFPEYDVDYFKQITAEQHVSTVNKRTGRLSAEWQVIPGRENHWLDTSVYARAAAQVLGIDRIKPRVRPPPAPAAAATPAPAPPPKPARQISDSGFLAGRGKAWIRKR